MFRRVTVACVVCFCISSSCVWAQKSGEPRESEGVGVFQNSGEYNSFMINLKTQSQGNPEMMAMIPLINDIVLQQPIGSTGQKYNATSTMIGLLADPEVRKELEMLDEQFDSLQKTNASIQKRAAEQLLQLDFSDGENVTSRLKDLRGQSEDELLATLLPHQMDRLRQILAQNQLRRRSLVDVLTSEPTKTRLEISDEQSSKLKQAEREINEELENRIAELRREAREKLVSKLTSKQQRDFDTIFGDTFEFAVNQRSKKDRDTSNRKKWKKWKK